jgi:very-short-patch-repair endonuclease
MKEKILECKSLSDICKLYGISINGSGFKKVRNILKEYSILESNFIVKSKYEKNPKICKFCGKKISYDKKENDFCNSSCSASFNNVERMKNGFILTDESKKKISLSLLTYNKKDNEYVEKICLYCGNTYTVRNISKETKRRYCSKECSIAGKKKNLSISMQTRIKNGTHKGWQSRNIESYPETFFKKVLENNNIKYEFNKVVSKRKLGLNSDANYFLDFFINNNIDLEIDGRQHKLDERIESDKIRDAALIKSGIVVYRIEWKNIKTENGKEYMKNEIDKFLKFLKGI